MAAPLYEPGPEALSSRRQITWEGVHRDRERLEESCVAAVVGATPPPEEWFPMTERVGKVWIAWLEPASWATLGQSAVEVRLASRAMRSCTHGEVPPARWLSANRGLGDGERGLMATLPPLARIDRRSSPSTSPRPRIQRSRQAFISLRLHIHRMRCLLLFASRSLGLPERFSP